MPEWVNMGYGEFAGRMPSECRLHLIEIPSPKRAKGHDTARWVEQEGERMLAAIPKGCQVIAMEVNGREWSTEELAGELCALAAERTGYRLAGGRRRRPGAGVCGAGGQALVPVASHPAPYAGARRGRRAIVSGMDGAAGPSLSSGHGPVSGQAPHLYLASASPRRRELLEQIGVAYRLLAVTVDEEPHSGESPEIYVLRLALDKARAGYARVADSGRGMGVGRRYQCGGRS